MCLQQELQEQGHCSCVQKGYKVLVFPKPGQSSRHTVGAHGREMGCDLSPLQRQHHSRLGQADWE